MTDATPAHELRYIPLEELHFDPENPRFPSATRGAGKEDALRWLLDSANAVDVMRSIATQDYFPGEPLLVVAEGDGYKVVEGNRRYAACWLLQHPQDAPTKRRTVQAISDSAAFRPTAIPALVFLDQSSILPFLGYRHITGIQEWSALAKARYLERLWENASGTRESRLRNIARQIGSRSDYVARLLTSLALFQEIERNEFFDIPGLTEESISFSLLVLATNRPGVARFLGLADGQVIDLDGLIYDRLREVTSWFFEELEGGRTLLGDSRNVSKLIEVIEDDDALASLRSGASLAHAHRLVDSGEDLSEALGEAQAWLESVLGALERGQRFETNDLEVVSSISTLWEEVSRRSSVEN